MENYIWRKFYILASVVCLPRRDFPIKKISSYRVNSSHISIKNDLTINLIGSLLKVSCSRLHNIVRTFHHAENNKVNYKITNTRIVS